jgi:hypothetical protein
MQNNYKFTPASNYCQPCRTHFQDYLQHTLTPEHANQIAASSANLYIEELATSFLHHAQSKRKIVKKGRKERGKSASKKNSCKILKDDISNIAKNHKLGGPHSKNSHQHQPYQHLLLKDIPSDIFFLIVYQKIHQTYLPLHTPAYPSSLYFQMVIMPLFYSLPFQPKYKESISCHLP